MNLNTIKMNRHFSSIFSTQAIKFARLAIGVSMMFSAAACVGSADELQNEADVEEVAEESQALGIATKVVGDTSCPTDYSFATPAEVRGNKAAVCSKLGTWDIARLAGGGSMDGPGYGCTVRDVDTRTVGHAVCKKPIAFVRGVGENVCPSGYVVANSMVARANQSALCARLGAWDIARLADGGSMDGPGYGCTIRDVDTRSLGHTACVQLDTVEAVGDKPCPAGTALISPQEARARQTELCNKLGQWDIARLEGGGSMDGPGYGCTIRDSDARSLGHALCGAL